MPVFELNYHQNSLIFLKNNMKITFTKILIVICDFNYIQNLYNERTIKFNI